MIQSLFKEPVRTPRKNLRYSRIAISCYFVLSGVVLSVWATRVPDIQSQVGASDGFLGMALLVRALGAVVAQQIAGSLSDRIGSSKLVVPSGIAMSLGLAFAGVADSSWSLMILLAIFGLAHGMLDIAMNSQAAILERSYGRPIMSSFHAIFSLGAILGAGFGWLAIHLDMTTLTTFVVSAIALIALALAASRGLVPNETSRVQPKGDSSPGKADKRTFLLGSVACCSLLAEGSVIDWSTLFMRTEMSIDGSSAVYPYWGFVIMMTLGRTVGDRAIIRFGPDRTAILCSVLSASGLGLAVLAIHPALSAVGFGISGLGLSTIVPIVFSAAANLNGGEGSAKNLSKVTGIGYLGLLAGPSIVGLISELVGLQVALIFPVLAMMIVLVVLIARREQIQKMTKLAS